MRVWNTSDLQGFKLDLTLPFLIAGVSATGVSWLVKDLSNFWVRLRLFLQSITRERCVRMTTEQAKWTSEHDQVIKPGLSDGRRAKFLPSAAARSYNWRRNEGYLGFNGASPC